jgi:hypothetical protein
MKDGLPSNDIRSVYLDRSGTVWAGTNGICRSVIERGVPGDFIAAEPCGPARMAWASPKFRTAG